MPDEATSPATLTAVSLITNRQTSLLPNARQVGRRRTKPIAAIAIFALALVLTATLVYIWFTPDNETQTLPDKAAEKKVVAVLPFKAIGMEKDFEYLGDGLTDVLITRLSNVREIVVRPTRSVLKYGNQSRDLTAIGRELRADMVLDGTIQKSGEKLRITVRLVNVQDGNTLWADQFDENLTDIFIVEDTISARSGAFADDTPDRTRAATHSQALHRKSRSPPTLSARSLFLGRDFKRAIELNPNYATAHQWYALGLASGGRHEESLSEMRRAQELDPSSIIINTHLGILYYLARRYDEAIEQYQTTLKLNPEFIDAHYGLGLAYGKKGMYEPAIVRLEQAVNLSHKNTDAGAALVYYYAQAGHQEKARRLHDEVVALSKQDFVMPDYFMTMDVGFGEKDKAFRYLEKMYERRLYSIIYLKVNPLLDPLRDDPCFQELLRKMNLN